jgi:cobalt/nickel transport system permease protein
MMRAGDVLADITDLEKYADRDSFVHSLDPRCKILLTLIFITAVVSFRKYEILALLPFSAFPFFLILSSGIPFMYLVKKLLPISFFAVMIGIANPLIDRSILTHVCGYTVSGGWISFASIMLRFALTASCALLLVMTTGMYNLTIGLEKLRIPQIFAVQLFFLCRYLAVLTDETVRMLRARDLRSFGKSGQSWKTASNMLSVLFIRSFDRAERIYTAMRCRGFDGTLPMARKLKWRIRDTFFFTVWLVLFVIFRIKVFEKL